MIKTSVDVDVSGWLEYLDAMAGRFVSADSILDQAIKTASIDLRTEMTERATQRYTVGEGRFRQDLDASTRKGTLAHVVTYRSPRAIGAIQFAHSPKGRQNRPTVVLGNRLAADAPEEMDDVYGTGAFEALMHRNGAWHLVARNPQYHNGRDLRVLYGPSAVEMVEHSFGTEDAVQDYAQELLDSAVLKALRETEAW